MPHLAERIATPSTLDDRLLSMEAPSDFPHFPDLLPPGSVRVGSYSIDFATTRKDFQDVQSLRYRTTNELLDASRQYPGRRLDVDAHDPWFHHLMIRLQSTGDLVATCRLQTASMAAARIGFHASILFNLSDIPDAMLSGAVEIGRFCIATAHRNNVVLRLLWLGSLRYMEWNSARYAFANCSLPGTSALTALEAWKAVHARGVLHDRVLVEATVHAVALADDPRKRPLIDAGALSLNLPPLLENYLALGGRVCSPPAFDRALGCTDFLVMIDVALLAVHRADSLFQAA